MNEKEEIRIELLKAVGWTDIKRDGSNALRGIPPGGNENDPRVICPNPCESLDALSKIERHFWSDQSLMGDYLTLWQDEYLKAVGYGGCEYWPMASAAFRSKCLVNTLSEYKK